MEEMESLDFADVPQPEHNEPIHIEEEKVKSILESLLFAAQKPVSMDQIRGLFSGTNIKSATIKASLNQLAVEYAGGERGVVLEEVAGGYQIRTKQENMQFIRRMVKGRPFKLSGPSLETLSIIAYKQPCVKSEVDQIRGVESGHLVRLLMEKGLVHFAGKSELPGKPMMYQTTRKFLEIFGLRNLRELPSLNEIEELIPEGIGAPEQEKKTLDQLTDDLSLRYGDRDIEAEDEFAKITNQLTDISTTTDFFEQEKQRQKEAREREKAEDIKERLMLGHEVSPRERNWLEKYENPTALGAPAEASPNIQAPLESLSKAEEQTKETLTAEEAVKAAAREAADAFGFGRRKGDDEDAETEDEEEDDDMDEEDFDEGDFDIDEEFDDEEGDDEEEEEADETAMN